jgi:predicted flavoprotein YhiN
VVASYTAFEEITPEQPLKMHIQPLADQWYEQWMQMLLEISMQHPKKELATILGTHVPKRFVLALLGELALQASQKIGTLTRDQRVLLSRTLGAWLPLHAIKRRPGDEFVTAGGVSLDEIDPATMQSIICPWLYFAGEIMDVDGVTWWFNLQASWAAGRLAGKSI